jgi:hypothetical protein
MSLKSANPDGFDFTGGLFTAAWQQGLNMSLTSTYANRSSGLID